MITAATFRRLCLILPILPALLFPLAADAQSLVTSGDYCNVKNPGGKGHKGTRKQEGEIQNILNDSQFSISCPIVTFYGASSYDIALTTLNYNNHTQTFKCVLSEYNPLTYRVRSYTRTSRNGAGVVDIIGFYDIELSDPLNRLHMRCNLPPRSAVGMLSMDSF